MQVEAGFAFVAAVVLVFIRLSALFLLTPLFAAAQVPVNVRTLFLLALAALLVLSLQLQGVQVPNTLGMFFLAGLHELLIGALLAFGLFTAFGVFLLGGRVLDFQMGFGVANLIDPATNTQGPLLGTVLNLMAVIVFILLDGHHLVIKGFAYSLQQVPIGQGLEQLPIGSLITQFGLMFVYGLMLVAPVIFTLLMVDVGLAVAARTMPQMNIFIVGLPVKIFVGLVVLALSLSYMNSLLKQVFESVFRYWEAILVTT